MTQSIQIEHPCLAPCCQERIQELEDNMLFLQGEYEDLALKLELYDSIFKMIRDQLGLALPE